MSTQQAVKTIEGADATVVQDAPIPKPRDDYVLVETRALSLNPTDWKHMRYLTYPGTTLGCDWSGVVLEVGKAVTKFKPGDEVFGVVHGGNNTTKDLGAFAQKIVGKEIATWHKPSNLSFEEAATLGVALITIGQSMYQTMGLPLPSADNLDKEPTKDMLVYGGSSGTGTIAIQFAKLSGLRVHATSSPSNFPLLRSRGASAVHDYNSPTSASEIQSQTNDSLSLILDCIGKPEYCASALGSQGGWYHSVAFPNDPKFKDARPEDNVRSTTALGYDYLADEAYEWKNGMRFEFDPKNGEFARGWQPVAQALVDRGLITPHPHEVRKGGLSGVLDGMREMEETGGPSGKKMVYPVSW